MTGNHVSEIQSNPHAAQLAKGFPWLRFEPRLEQEFMRSYWSNHRMRMRVGMIVGAIIFIAFSIKYVLTLPRSTWITTVVVVDGFIVPVLLFGALLTLRAQYQPWISKVGNLVLVLMWIGLSATLLESRALGTPIHYESMLLAIAFVLFSTGLRAVPALMSCIFGITIYLVGICILGEHPEVVEDEAFHLISITAIGAIGVYNRESMLRRLFLTQSVATFRAEHDPLTQLLNRGAAMRRLETAWSQAARQHNPIAVFLIDADHFKAYNDQYGHIEGDKCLQSIASAIKVLPRRPMDMVARFGGEEFVALAYDTDWKGAELIAEKVRIAVANMKIPLESGKEVGVTISIGVASVQPIAGDVTSTIVKTLRQADAALYAAKSAGRNCFVIS